jgi:hypothetical protein
VLDPALLCFDAFGSLVASTRFCCFFFVI